MRWLSFYRSAPDLGQGSRYTQATFGYVVPAGAAGAGQEGVVDVGARSEFSTLREAIAADALEQLVEQCGDQADLPLQGLHFAPTIRTQKRFSVLDSIIRRTRRRPVVVARVCPQYLFVLQQPRWAMVKPWYGRGNQRV